MTTHSGKRLGRPPGIPTPKAGRKPKGDKRRVETTITLDPALAVLIVAYSVTNECSFSESVNRLLAEVLHLRQEDKS
jgi:hypothetical protein